MSLTLSKIWFVIVPIFLVGKDPRCITLKSGNTLKINFLLPNKEGERDWLTKPPQEDTPLGHRVSIKSSPIK